MTEQHLVGQFMCADDTQAAVVAAELPRHFEHHYQITGLEGT